MNTPTPKISFTDEELELLEQINPELKLRLLGDPACDVPLSFPQQRIWLAQEMSHSGNFNNSIDLRIHGPLNLKCMEAAWNQVVLQNEALRTVIVPVTGNSYQQVLSYGPAELDVDDLTGCSAPFSEAKRRCIKLGNRDLDPTSGDMCRPCLFRLAEDDHIFHLTVNRVAVDECSWNILKRELKQFYEAALVGRLGVLHGQNKFRYTEFARWQRECLHGPLLAEHLSYWKMQLKDPPAPLELPADFLRPKLRSFRGRKEWLVFNTEFTESLKRFSHEHNVTLFTTVVAGFNALLWRYTGCDDMIVGTEAPNRVAAEHRDVIGCFTNLLPLRTHVSGDLTVKELLARIQETAVGAFAHQDLPFEKMVEELQSATDRNQNPLFSTALTYADALVKISEIADLTVTELEFDYAGSQFDLSIHLRETAVGLSGWIEYSTDLFEAATVRRYASHFETMLRLLLQRPESRLSDLSVLTLSERNQILLEWNRTAADFPRDKCVHQLFEQQVRENPEADAVSFKYTKWTYREVNARADGVACRLHNAGIGPGALVGVCVERSAEMVAVLLGVWKAGCAYVPLDPSHPPERIRDVCLDARVSLVITNTDFATNFDVTHLRLLLVEEIGDAPPPKAKAQPNFDPENLAYVIYTSGSTGKPKGVQIRHRSVTNALTAFARTTALTKKEYFLAVTTITFDIAVLELFLPLTTGTQVTILDRETVTNALKLAKIAERVTTTVMQATPATWRMLLEAGWRGNPHLTVICGGEAITANLAQQLLQRAKTVWNFYGPTEATVWCTGWMVQKGKRVSIGRPFNNLQTYILDEHLQPVPVGVVGELHIGGEGLAAGYLDRAELTAEKFISNPFQPDSIIYKTGDLARYMSDGNIECLGRVDHQLKIRGYRIEPGEIEAILAQHPDVRQAVVVGVDDTSGMKRLVAYLTKKGLSEVDSDALIEFLQSKLPAYMIPAQFVFIDKIPLSTAGKVDRKQLSQFRTTAG